MAAIPGAPGRITHLLLLTTTVMITVHGYPSGAPSDTCITMFPHHGESQQELAQATPYVLEVSSATYRPGQNVIVTLRSTDGRALKGFQVKAVLRTGNDEAALGTFVDYPANITTVISCEDGVKNMATHSRGLSRGQGSVTQIQLTWQAPAENLGNLVFVATVVENFAQFWTGVRANLDAEIPLVAQPQPTLSTITNHSMSVSLHGCGDTRGCFLYPRYCEGERLCKAAVAWELIGLRFRFTLYAKDADYIAMGISDDKKMGHDETVICTAEDTRGVASVQHGFNPDYWNTRMLRDQLKETSVARVDGGVACSFTRPVVSVTREINQSAPTLQYVTRSRDLNDDFYLMLAWGHVYKGSDVIHMHKELPPVTDGKVSFMKYDIYRGSSLPLEKRIHASLMVVAWVLAAGLATVMSRYYKGWLSDRAACGTAIWFQLHRAAGITAGLLTIASSVLILVVMKGYSEEEEKHAILGLTVLSLVGVQMLAGMLRPDKDSSFRVVFNVGHLFLGQSAHILSAVTMYLAFYIRFVPEVMREFGVIVLTVWAALQVAWTLFLELRARCCKDKESKGENSHDVVDSILLGLYLLTMVLLATAGLCAVNLF